MGPRVQTDPPNPIPLLTSLEPTKTKNVSVFKLLIEGLDLIEDFFDTNQNKKLI